MSSRYSSFTNSRSSAQSDPSSSTELKPKRLTSASKSHRQPPDTAPIPQSSTTALSKPKHDHSLSSMVKKLMEKKPKAAAGRGGLVVVADCLAEDLKKNGKKGGTSFGGLHKKLFKERAAESGKALTEVKTNTRTLAMVLRSERELLSQNKDLEIEITRLNLTIEEKNREVEKLKDLCLKQREEIKALKSAILFPDVMSTQLQEILEKQGSELRQAKQVIPSLQKQVISLTGQLQFLAEDLKEVKADKYSVRGCYDGHISSPRTPTHDQEAANSLEFSSQGHTTPGSPDDMFTKDLNPCLTPYYTTKSKEFEAFGYASPHDDRLSEISMQTCDDLNFDNNGKELSKSSDSCQCSNSWKKSSGRTQRSGESKFSYGKQMQHKLF